MKYTFTEDVPAEARAVLKTALEYADWEPFYTIAAEQPFAPAEPFGYEDVNEVLAWWWRSPEDCADMDVIWLLLLDDERFAVVRAWCDTTGWDCMAGGEAWIGTLGELLRWALTAKEREQLGIFAEEVNDSHLRLVGL